MAAPTVLKSGSQQVEAFPRDVARARGSSRQHRHEIDVAVPARHHVPVHVIGEARARAAPEICAEVEAVADCTRGANAHDAAACSSASAARSARSSSSGDARWRRGAIIRWPLLYGIAVEHHQRERPRVKHQAAAALTGVERTETEDAFAARLAGAAKVSAAPRRPQPQRFAACGGSGRAARRGRLTRSAPGVLLAPLTLDSQFLAGAEKRDRAWRRR